MARLGTLLTVVGLVLATFIGTGFANIGAKAAQLIGVLAVLGHERGGQATDLRALSIQADTFSHHVDVFLLQTGRRTAVAVSGANMTGFDA